MAQRVTESNFENEVLNSDKIVLVDFYSDSCVPCKRMSPVISQLEEENSDKLKVVKVNINFDNSLSEKYEITAAPTFVFIKNQKELSRIQGAVKKEILTQLLTDIIN